MKNGPFVDMLHCFTYEHCNFPVRKLLVITGEYKKNISLAVSK